MNRLCAGQAVSMTCGDGRAFRDCKDAAIAYISRKMEITKGETIYDQWPPFKRLRRRLFAPVFRVSDTGLFGLHRLRTHILICGYRRAGTTMLLAMMEYAMPGAKKFGQEVSGWRAATWCWRNHEVIVSKMPKDIFILGKMQNFYRGRRAKLKTIVLLRDPRDVLTSKHASHDRRYFETLEEWRRVNAQCQLHRADPDVLLIKYEDLIADVPGMQRRIEAFTGEKVSRPFADFYKAGAEGFDTRPLNGLRPVDRKGVGRWMEPEHRERIEQILREAPEFPQMLIELGYEKDESWIEGWRGEGSTRRARRED